MNEPLLLMGVVILICILLNQLLEKIPVPSLLIFIALGMFFEEITEPIRKHSSQGRFNAKCANIATTPAVPITPSVDNRMEGASTGRAVRILVPNPP